MLIRNQKGAGVFETLLVCIIVSILIGTVIPYYQKLTLETKEVALQVGLGNMRKAIELYSLLHGKYPPDLRSLVNQRYLITVREEATISGEYLRAQAVDQEGNMLDPFGNRFGYDSRKGTVFSKTKAYESW
jgi:type II secretory pathway pseudopilin PulG